MLHVDLCSFNFKKTSEHSLHQTGKEIRNHTDTPLSKAHCKNSGLSVIKSAQAITWNYEGSDLKENRSSFIMTKGCIFFFYINTKTPNFYEM